MSVLAMGVAAFLAAGTALASSKAAPKDGSAPLSVAEPQRLTLTPPPPISDPVKGMRISITQVQYPGVPERSACRFLVRAFNAGTERMGVHTLLHTFDSYKEELNTWLVPTGDLAPGQSVERIYSCKTAQYLVIDKTTAGSWPGRCLVNGEERTPCPAVLQVDTNIQVMKD